MTNFRDSRGWRVPAQNTISRDVYDLTLQGKWPKEIERITGVSRNHVRVVRYRFMHPERDNARARRYMQTGTGVLQ